MTATAVGPEVIKSGDGMCDLAPADDDGERLQRQHLSLMRCLSEAVLSEENNATSVAAAASDAATILRSLSETCLARDDDEAIGGGAHQMLRDPYLQPALIATNVDDDDDDEEEEEVENIAAAAATAAAASSTAAAAAKDFRCNCGCGVALKTSPVDDPDDYEDEGCYLGRRRRTKSANSDNSERQKETGAEDGETCSSTSSDPPSTASSAATTLNAASKSGEKSSSYTSSSSSASTSSTASGCKDGGGGGNGGTGRRSFSSSVDSGRSSDTGTLGGSESDCSVKIVSHSFCDVLGSGEATVRGEAEPKSEDGEDDDAPARERLPEMPTIMSMGGGGNKVAVFVPFSAISEYKHDAARAAERRRRLKESGGGHHSVTDVFMDNVVICDTQVILRINCTAPSNEQLEEEEEEEETEGRKGAQDTSSDGTSGQDEQVAEESGRPEAEFTRRKPLPVSPERMTKLKKSRMSRRMTTTVAVYEMVNAARKCKQDALEEAEEGSGEGREGEADLEGSLPLRSIPEGESSHGGRPSSVPRSPSKAPPPPRRKDLCKLLGLIECDVTTDATSPEDIKVAQKVAIDNLLTAIKENQRKSEEGAEASSESAETSMRVGEAATLQRPQVAKKDLAKFLGIDDEKVAGPPAPATNLNQKSNQRPQPLPQPQPQRQKKKSLVNWSQIMKQSMSMRWRPADESPARSQEKKPSATQLPHGLDFELPVQLKRVNEVLDCPPEVDLAPDAPSRSTKAAHGHRKKNLNKFLGMDDSDSEEMVFIQNRRSGPGKGGEAAGAGGGGDDGGGNSLNRSDQGSSIVGIRIVNADDLTFSSKSVEECANRISSSYSSSPSSTISSRDSKQRPSAINGFLRRSANITSQAKPSLRSSSLPHSADRHSSLASSSSSRLARSREDEMTVVGDVAAASGDPGVGGGEDDVEFSPPPRKNVVFKEYTNFCVEESIALGLPIIPSNGNASSGSTAAAHQDGSRGRKKKKDAERRSAELVAGTAPKQPNHQYFFSSTAASLARGKGGAHGKKASKKNSLEAYLQSSNHDWLLEPPQQEGTSLHTANGTSGTNKGGKQKVARNTVVRGSEPVYLDMFRHQQMVAAAAAAHQYHHHHSQHSHHGHHSHLGHHSHHSHHSLHSQQQHHAAAAAAFHHAHPPHPHLPNGALPRYLSCSPKGRVRAVKQRPYQHRQQEQQPHHHHQRRQQQRPEYFDELNKVLQA